MLRRGSATARRIPTGLLIFALSVFLALPAGAVECLVSEFAATPPDWPDYAALDPALTPSCAGTNNQSVDAIDRVVFLGDSVAVGTPPTTSNDFFRSQLADQLVAQYGLAAPAPLWKAVNSITGTSLLQDSGDFSSCAVWGARAEDLLGGAMQIDDCFPSASLTERTLVVIAVGGNDFSTIALDSAGGATPAELQATLDAAMADLRAAIEWFVTPGRFPNGVFVVLANPLDFTDGTGDSTSCPAAVSAGLEPYGPVASYLAEGNETMLDIVEDNEIDLVFARERFCGHGFASSDPAAPCYRGPGNANWFDASCLNPNPVGHGELAEDFFDVITTAAATAVPSLSPMGLLLLVLAGGGVLGANRVRRD